MKIKNRNLENFMKIRKLKTKNESWVNNKNVDEKFIFFLDENFL